MTHLSDRWTIHPANQVDMANQVGQYISTMFKPAQLVNAGSKYPLAILQFLLGQSNPSRSPFPMVNGQNKEKLLKYSPTPWVVAELFLQESLVFSFN